MVQVDGLGKLLKEHPFFKGMDKKSRDFMAGCAKNEVFDAGKMMVCEGEMADKFYLVRHGCVAIELHVPGKESVILETVGADGLFGWSSLVQPYRWTFDVRAVELTQLFSLDAKCARKKMENDHSLGYELYKRFMPIMAKRLETARLQLIDVYGRPES